VSATRRELLLGALAAGGALALGGRRARAAPIPTRPRALIQVFLSGGIDAIYTTDPKRRSEIEPKVDAAYVDADIVERPLHRVGPFFKPLGGLIDRFAILNGVECSTVAHPVGQRLVRQMRRTHVPGAPSLCSLVGALQKERRPMDEIRVGDTKMGNGVFSEQMLGPAPRSLAWQLNENPRLFQRLWTLSRDGVRARVVKEALRAHAGDHAGATERSALEATTALLEAMPAEPPPTGTSPAIFIDGEPTFVSAEEWQPAWDSVPTMAWLLRHRLATTLFVDINLPWDTHFLNTRKQKDCCAAFVPYLRRLLTALDETLTPEGLPLSSEVAVLISSELGRFPFTNPYSGKDHLPELPVMIAGPGVRPGQYGETTNRMLATPIARTSGRPGGKGAAIPALEAIGASVLSWFGERDPLRLGYLAEPLDFLFA
jgi:hypothetical protein